MNWYINYFEKSTPQLKKLQRLDFLRCLTYLLVIDSSWSEEMTAATTVLSPTVGRDQLGQNKCQHKVGRYDLRGTESSNVANKPRLSVMSRDQVETDIRLWSVNPLKNG